MSADNNKRDDTENKVKPDTNNSTSFNNLSDCHFHINSTTHITKVPEISNPNETTKTEEPSNAESGSATTSANAPREGAKPEKDQVIVVGSAVHHLWCLPITIGRARVNAYVDSGAMSCVMQKKVYDMYPKGTVSLRPFHGVVQGINGPPAKVYGMCDIPYDIEGYTYHAPTVIADVGPKILLGLSFLHQHEAVVNYRTGLLTMKGSGREFMMTQTTFLLRVTLNV